MHSLLRPRLNLLFHSYQIQFQTFLCRTLLFNNFSLYLARTTSLSSPFLSPSLSVTLYLCVVLCFSPCYDCAGCVRQFLFTVLSICAALVTYFYLCSHFAPSSTSTFLFHLQFQFHFQSPCKFLHNPRAKFLTEINSFLSLFYFFSRVTFLFCI